MGPSDSSNRYRLVESLYQRALDQPPAHRLDFLNEHCAGDDGLRREVQTLLEHYDAVDDGFLCRAAIDAAAAPMPARIGPYRLIEVLGEGGMGIVYRAEQDNPRREVAVKVIRGGRYVDEYTVRLFQREVQALARLRHPCIGAIHEAGRTADAQHYFAMELVQGRGLLEHVREAGVGLRGRLNLFESICDAIHYAHQRGVMHRDLKPSNILVDDAGRPKILDFGLARIADLDFDGAAPATATGRIQGTLSYMSPEQARGDRDAIDTRSDVYSLGVILYELLTDRLPYALGRVPLPEAVSIVCTQSPMRPGQAAAGQPWSIDRDLDTIVLKALEKEPSRRYASAAALADDLRRLRSHQPILARPASAAYQIRKLIARHKLVFSFAATLLAVVVGAGIWMTVLYGQQHRERLRAEEGERRAEAEASRANEETAKAIEERNKTEKFAGFMEEILGGAGPAVAQGRDTSILKEMMDSAAKRIDDGEIAEVPAAEFRLRDAIGEVYMEIGEHDAAERVTTPMVALAQRAFGEVSVEYAMALDSHAAWLHAMGRFDEGLAEAEDALTVYRRLYANDHELTVACLNRIGSFLISKGRPADAAVRHGEALEMSRRLFPGDHYNVAISLSKLGDSMQHQGRFAEALPRHEEALAMFQRLQDGDNPDVTIGLNRVALDLSFLGRPGEALPKFEEALAMRRRLFPGNHPRVVESLRHLANCLVSLGRPVEALPLFEEALTMSRGQYTSDHQDLATSIVQRAVCLVALNRAAEAVSGFEEALAMFRRLFPGDHPQVAWAMSKSAQCLSAVERKEEALTQYEETLAMMRRLYPGGHPELSSCMLNVAGTLNELDRAAEALPFVEEALSMARAIDGGDSPRTAVGLTQRARCLQALDRDAEALRAYEEALGMYQRLYPGDHANVASALGNAAGGLQAAGRLEEALARCDEALAMMRRVHPPGNAEVRGAEVLHGSILGEMKRFGEAEEELLAVWGEVADREDVPIKLRQDCADALVKLNEAWNTAEPGTGHDAEAAEFRTQTAALRR